MPILYSVIARGPTVLAKHAACEGNFEEVTEQILTKIPPNNEKLTYSQGPYLFHYICEDSIIYMCITDDVSAIFSNKSCKWEIVNLNCLFLSLGLPKIKSIPVSQWNQEKTSRHLRRRRKNCPGLCHEHWIWKSFDQWNGTYFSIGIFF